MEALIPLIIQYSLQYGLPAAIQLIEALKKDGMSWEDIQAAFKTAQTAYGLTPQIVPPGVTTVARITKNPAGQITELCDYNGACFAVDPPGALVRDPAHPDNPNIWKLGGRSFWILSV